MCKLLNAQEYLVAVEMAVEHFMEKVEFSESYLKKVRKEIQYDLCRANRTGELEDLAEAYGIQEYLNTLQQTKKDRRKILLIGDSHLKKKDIYRAFSEYDISSEDIDMMDYDLKKFDVRYLNGQYEVILSGPVPHKGKGMGKKRNLISSLEEEVDTYRLGSNSLKITKNTLNRTIRNIEWN